MYVFDFEVFKYDWMVVFKDTMTGEYTEIVNNSVELERFYNQNRSTLLIGFNNKAYDNLIFRAILSGVNPYVVSSTLFQTEKKHLVYEMFDIGYFKLTTMDLMQDNLRMSLKELEGHMGMSIQESGVSFDIDRKLTQAEIEEVLIYCRHDVDSTQQLLQNRQKYIHAKLKLISLFNLPIKCSEYTNARLCAEILSARKVYRQDEMEYDLPQEVDIHKYTDIVKLYVDTELDYERTAVVDIAGVPHTLAYGGLHGALRNFNYSGELWQIDATSYYPSLMIEYDYLSRNVYDTQRYKDIYLDRISSKKTDPEKAEALKLVLNTTYGAMKNENNPMYDPKMANQVCITGQLLLVDLIEKLEPYCRLVQSNTDGILIIPYNKDEIRKVMREWQNRTRINLEVDVCTSIWQKDVNNYIMRFENGQIKTKGGYVSQYSDGTRRSMRIVDIALVDYFTKNIPVEHTILSATDILDFQIIKKTGGTYLKTMWECNGVMKEVNKVNRVYASKEIHHGKLYKIKEGRVDAVANLPEHCVIDNDKSMKLWEVDKHWYIDIAKKRIADFTGD